MLASIISDLNLVLSILPSGGYWATFFSDHWLDIAGTIIGLIYIYQEYKASIWLWATGIIMPVVYMFVYLDAGLYADFGMQVYYTLAAIYGLLVWKFGKKKGQQSDEMPITHVRPKIALWSIALFAAAWVVIYFVLIRFTNSNVPILDSFGNALSIIGLWWLARKYIEQWFLWIIVDAELAALYVYKGIPFTAGLYFLYVIIAIAGYFKWKRMMKSTVNQ